MDVSDFFHSWLNRIVAENGFVIAVSEFLFGLVFVGKERTYRYGNYS